MADVLYYIHVKAVVKGAIRLDYIGLKEIPFDIVHKSS
jgi:hypothetical protein